MKRWLPIVAIAASLGLSLGWVVVTVLRARDENREAHCLDNLKSIALGLHNYHQVFDSFPLGTVPNPSLAPEHRLSWVVGAWGFVGDGQIHLNIDHSRAWDDPVNLKPTGYSGVDGPGATTELFFYGCPASAQTLPPTYSRVLQYVGVGGLGVDSPALPSGHPRIGVFGHDRVTRLADITDGAFTTMMVIETADRNGPWTAGGPNSVRGLDPSRTPYIGTGRQFGGNHARGVAVLFADASVRLRTPTIHPKLFEASATIAGNTANADPDDSP